jgi:UDP-glucose 4-epimerase
MKFFVTGASGFIGSNLVERLLIDGHSVVGYDNMRTGREKFLDNAIKNENFKFIKGDIFDQQNLINSMSGCDVVAHLAANADVRGGVDDPVIDLELNTFATAKVLEAMRFNNVKKIIFSSTGSVYGNKNLILPTPEFAPMMQSSFYGASKLACEGLIQAHCEAFGVVAWIYRFVSVLGPHYSHGHIYDVYKSLRKDPKNLNMLGDGTQRKSYMHVSDCIDGIEIGFSKGKDQVNIFNLGVDATITVNESFDYICKWMKANPYILRQNKKIGWIGDNPMIHLNCERIANLGWEPKYSIRDGIKDTLEYLSNNEWVLKED